MEKSSSQPFPFTLQGHSRRLLQSRVPTVEATVSIPANLGSPAGRHLASCRAELCSNVSSQTSEQLPVSGHQVLCAFVAAAMVQPETGDTLSCASLSFSAQCCCEHVSVFPQVLCSGSGYEQECPFCPYTWGAVMITASLPEAHTHPMSLVLGYHVHCNPGYRECSQSCAHCVCVGKVHASLRAAQLMSLPRLVCGGY